MQHMLIKPTYTTSKKFLLFAATILCCMRLDAQTVPETLRINYLDPVELNNYKSARHGDTIIVELYNFNRGLYNIEGGLTQENTNAEMPAIFKGIALPDFIDVFLPSAKEELLKGQNSFFKDDYVGITGKTLSQLDKTEQQLRDIKEQIIVINASTKTLHDAALLSNTIGNLYKSCGLPYDVVESQLVQAVNKFTGKSTLSRDEQVADIQQTLDNAISAASTASGKLEQLLPPYAQDIKLLIRHNNGVIVANTGKPPATLATHQNEDLTAHLDSVKTLVTKAMTNTETLLAFRKDNKIQLFADAYNKINSENFTFLSDPLPVRSDKVSVSLKITAKETLTCNEPSKVSLVRTYYTKGGWKVDFSAGVFFNAGNPDFIRREFYYKPLNDSIRTIEAADAGTKVLLSAGALMHIYRRSGEIVNWAISPGLSTTTAFDGLNFHLGGSLLIGRDNRIVLTAGATARETKVLDLHYNIGQPYEVSATPDDVPTVKKFPEFGWFLALTYNWSALK
jgi:hypothetical protein